MTERDLNLISQSLSAINDRYYVQPAFGSGNFYKFTFVHEGSPVRSVEATVEPDALESAFERLLGKQGEVGSSHEFVNAIMGISEGNETGQEFYDDPVYEI